MEMKREIRICAMQDVRVRRCAGVVCDHPLVTATLQDNLMKSDLETTIETARYGEAARTNSKACFHTVDENHVAEEEAQWAENFKKIMNRLPPKAEADIQDYDVDFDVEIKPKIEDIMTAIRFLKRENTPSNNKLNAEPPNTDAEIVADVLQPLFEAI